VVLSLLFFSNLSFFIAIIVIISAKPFQPTRLSRDDVCFSNRHCHDESRRSGRKNPIGFLLAVRFSVGTPGASVGRNVRDRNCNCSNAG